MTKIKLSFKEHYFTASKHKGGFFTLDNTEGLKKEEITELEKKGIYNPPIKLPTAPTEEEMENLFPTNISFFKLKSSGKYVFLHSKYIGKTNDSVSRYGNYFSHSLILSESIPSYPVKFIFENAVFKKSFSVEEDEAYAPSLKTEQQFEIDTADFWIEKIFRDFQTFLIHEPNRINVFSKVFDLIVEGKIAKAGYNITICDKKENLTDLIFAVNYFLPSSLANKVSFATYVDNPDSINYPFEITGIIPECGIDRLPEQYFNLVEATKFSDYIAIQPYTKLLIEIITNGDYSKWKNILMGCEEFEITELNQKLNAPASFIEFKINVRNKSLEDFRELLSHLTEKKRLELKEFVLKENSELYLNYILLELAEITADNFTSTSKKCDSFLSLYTQHFNNGSSLSQDLFLQFTEGFRDKFTGLEKSRVSLYILSNLNCIELRLKNIEEVLQSADFYFEEESINFEEKLEAVKSLNLKYPLREFQDLIPNIMKVKTFDEIFKAATTGNLFKSIDKHKNKIKELSYSEKLTVFVSALNHENVKNQFDLSFGKYIRIIKEFFPETESYFWYSFFESNRKWNPDNDFKKHTLEFLKKKFVVANFTNELHRPELFEKLSLDSYSMKWIEEEIRETSRKNSMVEEFYSVFENSSQARSSGWFSKLNPFKKQ